MDGSTAITQLLQAAAAGDQAANNALFDSVYQELHQIARAQRRRWTGNETMNTTALIHEAYAKMAGSASQAYADRTHFFATASKAMRQILMNYAQRLSTAKRGANRLQVTLSRHMPVQEDNAEDLLLIDELLNKIEEQSPRDCRLFECRVFGGMTIEETATALGVSPATVKRDWSLLIAWLYREMKD